MSDAHIALSFNNIRSGWCDLALTIGDQVLPIEGFSYCSDTFLDFARLALDIVLGAHQSTIHLDGEPVEWRLSVRRDWTASHGFRHHLVVRTFQDIHREQPDSAGDEYFAAEISGDGFAAAVCAELQRIRDEVGILKFESDWMLPFPSRGLAALETALATPLRPQPI